MVLVMQTRLLSEGTKYVICNQNIKHVLKFLKYTVLAERQSILLFFNCVLV